jgi:hypothetical protein
MLTMTPQARATAAFTLAVLVLTGHLNRIAFAAYVASGVDLPGGDGARLVLSLLTVAIAVAVWWLAHTTAEAGAPGWDTSLAQAARVLALIGIAIAVLATIAVLTNDQAFFGTLSLGS